jgi:hypothetical protein
MVTVVAVVVVPALMVPPSSTITPTRNVRQLELVFVVIIER